MNTKPLIDYFNNILLLNDEETAYVEAAFKERRVKRRQYILQQGDICQHTTFVVAGCFRTYVIDNNGKEHNLQFAVENSWTVDIQSFFPNEPSQLNIEAMENSVVLQIKREDQFKLYLDYPKFNRIFRVLAENYVVRLQRRILHNISLSSEERYADFLERYPNLLNRISNVQIASYLGVTPEFLSTIRKRMANS